MIIMLDDLSNATLGEVDVMSVDAVIELFRAKYYEKQNSYAVQTNAFHNRDKSEETW